MRIRPPAGRLFGTLSSIWWAAVLAFALTVGGLTLAVIAYDRRGQLRLVEARALSLARIFVDHAERAIGDGEKLITAMAPGVLAWDRADAAAGRGLFAQMRGLLVGSPQLSSAWIVDGQGATVLDSWSYPPAPAPAQHRRYFQLHAAGASGPVLAGRELGSVTGRDRFTLSRALRDAEGRLAYVVVVGIYSDYFASLYAEVANWPEAGAGLFLVEPETTTALARLQPPAETEPPAVAELTSLFRRAATGTAQLGGGGARVVGWHGSGRYRGLFASTSQSVAAALAGARWRAFGFAALGAVATLAFAGLGAYATRLERARVDALRQSVLMREVHHRVKNNLFIVVSLIRGALRLTSEPAARARFEQVAGQVAGIATLYDHMQALAVGERVDVNEIVAKVCAALAATSGRPVEFTPCPPVRCEPEKVTTLLIVLNELVTNSIKHAAAQVTVICTREDPNHLALTVGDDGPGLPADFDPALSKGFGLRLVAHLAQSAGGGLEVVSARPAAIRVRMPVG